MERNEKQIFTTKDYNQFKILKGNREITPVRVRKIITSIKKVGYITNPIIVNEKMEVIDGQGRLKALKELRLPVDYIVVQGAGIEQCLNMNINQTKYITEQIYNKNIQKDYAFILTEYRRNLMSRMRAGVKGFNAERASKAKENVSE